MDMKVQWHSQEFSPGEQILGVWRRKSPSGVQAQSPGDVWGQSPPEADDFTTKMFGILIAR